MKPIWYFVGLILLVMGLIIFVTGVYQFFYPPEVKTHLSKTNPGIWWGAVMVCFGGLMYWKSKNKTV